VIDEAAADDEAPDPTITTQAAAPTLPSWDDMPLTANTTWHRVPADGLQGYVEPNGDGALAQFVPGNSRVAVVEQQGEWAQIRMGATTSWVDGRTLLPPTVVAASTASRTTVSPSRKSLSSNNMWAVLSAVAGLGVLVGAVVEWFSYSLGINSFDLPMQVLFDSSSSLTNREPRIGYFVATFGVVAILTSFSRDLTWVRRIAGVLTFLIALRFCYQLQDSLPGYSNVDFWDIVGAGPLIAGFCGLALAVLPGP
jgi:hypothetical protein